MAIPASILSSGNAGLPSANYVPSAQQSFSLPNSSSVAPPFTTSSTYQMPNANLSNVNGADNGLPSVASGSTAIFGNTETFRHTQAFAPSVVAVPLNHISPSASDGQRSTTSQPSQQNQRGRSTDDGLVRSTLDPETEKSPHVFTSVSVLHAGYSRGDGAS